VQQSDEEVSMMLLLSETEARELGTALVIYLDQLQREVMHTDDRDFKKDLKSRLEHLEDVKSRLEALVAQIPAEA
jgi:hypothetical protein